MAKRKPQLNAHGPKGDRQSMWEAIRALHTEKQPINVDAVWSGLIETTPKGRVRDYFTGLEKAGYLVREPGEYKTAQTVYFKLIRDVGVEAPRVRRDGTEPTGGQGREQLWRTLKIVGDCTARELADAASTPQVTIAETTANEYLRFLTGANYVTVVRAGAPGVMARYRLVPTRWTGPRAPMIQRTKQLYDPNTGEVVFSRVTKTEGGEP